MLEKLEISEDAVTANIMKKLLKTLSLLVVIGIIGFLLGQNYPNAFRKHTKTTVIQVNPLGKTVTGLDRPLLTGHFFQTQFSIIRSDETILKAINDYRLDKLWNTNKEDLLKEIRGALDLSQVKGSDFIELKTSADDDEKAQQLAYAMVMTYQAERIESINNRRNEVIEKYKEKIKFQESKVADIRNSLYKISKILGGYENTMTLLYTPHHVSKPDKPDSLKQIYDRRLLSIQELEIFVKSLQGLDDSAVASRIITSSRPEAVPVEAQEKILRESKEAKQQLIANGHGLNHPKVLASDTKILKAEKKLSKYVRDIREKLANDLTFSKQALAKFKARVEQEEDIEMIIDEEPTAFDTVKDEYEREFRILQALKQADLREVIISDLKIEPLKLHKYGWTPETAKMMEARKK